MDYLLLTSDIQWKDHETELMTMYWPGQEPFSESDSESSDEDEDDEDDEDGDEASTSASKNKAKSESKLSKKGEQSESTKKKDDDNPKLLSRDTTEKGFPVSKDGVQIFCDIMNGSDKRNPDMWDM